MIYINDHLQDFDLDAALETMPQWRRQITLQYKNDLLRCQSAAAFALLQTALAEQYHITDPIRFITAQHGKPALEGHPDIHFNLSHCLEAAICVVADQPVGVDIEHIRHPSNSMIAYVMTPDEQRQINHADQPDFEFTRIWTSKEAALKHTGDGLQGNFRDILSLPHPPITTRVSPDRRYIYSICTNAKLPTP